MSKSMISRESSELLKSEGLNFIKTRFNSYDNCQIWKELTNSGYNFQKECQERNILSSQRIILTDTIGHDNEADLLVIRIPVTQSYFDIL